MCWPFVQFILRASSLGTQSSLVPNSSLLLTVIACAGLAKQCGLKTNNLPGRIYRSNVAIKADQHKGVARNITGPPSP